MKLGPGNGVSRIYEPALVEEGGIKGVRAGGFSKQAVGL